MTRAELAEHYRVVAITATGIQHRMTNPNFAVADQVLGALANGEDIYSHPSHSPLNIEEFHDTSIWGVDNRRMVRNSDSYPFSVHADLRGCSSTLISESIAFTAAHCVWNRASGTTFRVRPQFAADSLDSPAVYARYPVCADVYVSNQWQTGSSATRDDWALIDFRGCTATQGLGPKPGVTVGYFGMGPFADTTLFNSWMYGYGYPIDNGPDMVPCPVAFGGPDCLEPMQWGVGHRSSANGAETNLTIRNRIDIDDGQSGAGIYMILSNRYRYVVGIHKGNVGAGAGQNSGRRVTNGLVYATFFTALIRGWQSGYGTEGLPTLGQGTFTPPGPGSP